MDSSLVDEVWARANAICEYCRLPQQFDVLTFQIDHVIARKHHAYPVAKRDALGTRARALQQVAAPASVARELEPQSAIPDFTDVTPLWCLTEFLGDRRRCQNSGEEFCQDVDAIDAISVIRRYHARAVNDSSIARTPISSFNSSAG